MSADQTHAADLDGDDGRRADEIEQDISRRRANLGDTLEELQERLSPSHIVHEATDAIKDRTRTIAHDALDTIRDGARTKAMSIVEKIKANPLPYALIGAGAAWLLMGGSKSARSDYAESDYGDGDPYITSRMRGFAAQGLSGASEYAQQAAGHVGSAYQAVGQHASDAVGGLGAAAGQLGQHMAGVGAAASGAVQQGIADLADRTRDYRTSAVRAGGDLYQNTLNQVSSITDEHPLILAALGIAVGAAVGGLIPSTDQENALFGERRDELLRRATDAGQDLLHQASDAGHGLAESAKRVAATTLDTAKQNALDELAAKSE